MKKIIFGLLLLICIKIQADFDIQYSLGNELLSLALKISNHVDYKESIKKNNSDSKAIASACSFLAGFITSIWSTLYIADSNYLETNQWSNSIEVIEYPKNLALAKGIYNGIKIGSITYAICYFLTSKSKPNFTINSQSYVQLIQKEMSIQALDEAIALRPSLEQYILQKNLSCSYKYLYIFSYLDSLIKERKQYLLNLQN